MQLHHHLDLIKSLLWPSNAQQGKIPRTCILTLFVTSGGQNPFIDALIKEPHVKRDKNYFPPQPDKTQVPFITDKPITFTLTKDDINL